MQSEGLFIVGMGELAVYSGDTETGHLIDGDYFGELSLVTDKEQRTSRVVAITPCVVSWFYMLVCCAGPRVEERSLWPKGNVEIQNTKYDEQFSYVRQ